MGSRNVFHDFEASGYRHALLDGSYSRIRYLHSAWARQIPVPIQRRMLSVYRKELARGCEAAANDDRFHAALIACSAGWLAGLLRLLPEVRDGDKCWGRSTNRQRILAALEHFSLLAKELDRFPATGETAMGMAANLRRQWGAEGSDMTFHSAFSRRPDGH
jgi:hypothetical protein